MEEMRKASLEKPSVEKVTLADLNFEAPGINEISIILQRNIKDIRDSESEIEMGSLDPEEAEETKRRTKDLFDEIFKKAKSPRDLDILVVAANSFLGTEMSGVKSEKKRAVETGRVIMEAIREAISENNLNPEQLINKKDTPSEISRLKDAYMFDESPDYVDFLRSKYGEGKDFWVAFESDAEKETRLRFGAEGPIEIADRINSYISIVVRAMKSYMSSRSPRGVIVYMVSHYDSMSPYIKRHILKMGEKDFLARHLPIDHGAGIVLNVDKDGETTTKLNGIELKLTPLSD